MASDTDGSVSGLITLSQLRRVPSSERASILVRDAAIPLDQVTTAAPNEPVTALLARLHSMPGGRVLVVDRDRVVGIVAPSDITKVIEARRLAAR